MAKPNRIISLVPSLTELLIDLGVGEQLIGRTRFCIHPKEKMEEIEIIGGTKNPKIEKIRELKPDFILANKEENREEDIEELSEFSEVLVTEINTIEDALITINELGKIMEAENRAHKLIGAITEQLEEIPKQPSLSVAYFIWKEPWMTVGGDTYIHDVLNEYNLQNVYGREKRYPKTSLAELATKNPDLILLSSEPFPFKEKHKKEIEKTCPASKIELVNGEWFSWYGSRMVKAFRWLNKWRATF